MCATVFLQSSVEIEPVDDFITRWRRPGSSKLSKFHQFINELCEILGIERPNLSSGKLCSDDYCFDRPVKIPEGDGSFSSGLINLYKHDSFVMMAKQASGQEAREQGARNKPRRKETNEGIAHYRNAAMQRAQALAELYSRSTDEKGRPPFVIVVDIGNSIDLYADFSLSGKCYARFPDAQSFRIPLEKLRDPAIRSRLKAIWTDPLSLDPTRNAERVTEEVSESFASITRSLERQGHSRERVAGFLIRCLFSMFAEDIGLLKRECFTRLLKKLSKEKPKRFVQELETFWGEMDQGASFSSAVGDRILRFNGGLFRDRTVIPLKTEHFELLIEAANRDWTEVEPAIFGTFLKRALDSKERKKLGTEFTPRRWVERLILPTVIEPLRKRWQAVQAAAFREHDAGRNQQAIDAIMSFHAELRELRILDPACGTGNFLYVTMEHMKRLESEVHAVLRNDLGASQAALDLEASPINPRHFLGIETNDLAAKIAEVVLWIGYLQWHSRIHDDAWRAEPILEDYDNIQNRDALISYDRIEEIRDEQGELATLWDRHSTKLDLVTGQEIPDESKRIKRYRYINPKQANWPEADYIIGNPPFTGGKELRERLGGYADALWSAFPAMPRSADLVMYWWHRAAEQVRTDKAKRFGLITTNSIAQTFNRRVVTAALNAKKPLSLLFVIPDHPWYLDNSMASVRIAMTVGVPGKAAGELFRVVDAQKSAPSGGDALLPPTVGQVQADLSIGIDVDQARPLVSNSGLCSPGVKLHGNGFIVTPDYARQLGLGRVEGLGQHIRKYRNGRDLAQRPRNVMAIDFFGLSESQARKRFPDAYQHILQNVKPVRDQNNRKSYRDKWWIFGEPRSDFRPALDGLKRYIATVVTAKHRIFQFLDQEILPDDMLVSVASDDAHILGVLSSRIHTSWALNVGSTLENRPRYLKSRCFDPFPFPKVKEGVRKNIRNHAEELDDLRKKVIAEHPDLNLTRLYNFMEKISAGELLSDDEKDAVHRGFIPIMMRLHEEIDKAVAAAYGWPVDIPDAEILTRLVSLNRERMIEEAAGTVHYLRPEYQEPMLDLSSRLNQFELELEKADYKQGSRKMPWPESIGERATIVAEIIAEHTAPSTLDSVARSFKRRPRKDDLRDIIKTLVEYGAARRVGDDRYAA